MDKRATLLFINGPVGVGKSTIARKYVDNHKLSLLLSADDFVGSMGQWLKYEDEARDLAFEYLKHIALQHLKAGHDVVVPYLLTDPIEAESIEDVAHSAGANFFECVLLTSKEDMIARALARGTWGEPGAPPLTQHDVPRLEELFDNFQTALSIRSNAVQIISKKGNIEDAYSMLIEQLNLKLSR